MTSERLSLRTGIAKYPETMPLWDGTITSPRIGLDLVHMEPTPEIFREMLRNASFDLSEMAITTHAMAVAHDKPIIGLPIPLWRLLHHNSLICTRDSDITGPQDLAGRKIAVRAYSQTTGVWIRGILESEYGLDLDSVTWVTLEDAHVAEYRDPSNVVRAAPGKSLKDLLLSGEVDAAMGLRKTDPAKFRTVIPDADAAALAWQRKTGVFPVNHILVVKSALVQQHPWLPQEILSLFTRAKRFAQEAAGTTEDTRPYGVEPNRRAMEMLLNFAVRQKLTPRLFSVDELFDPDPIEPAR